MDENNTVSLKLTGKDKRKIRDDYEQVMRETERKKMLGAVNIQLGVWHSLSNAILDLNNTLLIISTLVSIDHWNTLHDERLIQEIGGSIQLIAELCKELDDSLLNPWQQRLEIIVNMYTTALRLFIQQDRKADLQAVVRQIGGKPVRMPIITVQGTLNKHDGPRS